MDWSCLACTFINCGTSECECCGAKRSARHTEKPSKRARPSQPDTAKHEVVCLDSDSDFGDQPTPARVPSSQPNGTPAHTAQHLLQSDLHAGTSSMYVLDACGCHSTADVLTAHILQQVQEQVIPQSAILHAAIASLSCNKCCKCLSSQDLYKLVGGATLGQVYAALTAKIKQEYDRLNSIAVQPCCSNCPAGTLLLSASCLTQSSSTGSSRQQPLPSKQALHAALQARQRHTPRTDAQSAAALAQCLGPNCGYFCTGCTATWPKADAAAAAVVDAQAAAAAAAAANPEAAAAVKVALELWSQLALLQQVMLQGSSASAASTATAKDSQQQEKVKWVRHSKGKQSIGSRAWAAGTGYGGNAGGLDAKAQQAIKAAAKRQKETDAAISKHLTDIRSTFSSKCSSCRGAGAASSSATAAAAGVAGCAVLFGGPLAWLLRLLFSHDSLMDIGARQELYREAMSLLRLIGSSLDLLPILQLPADDPRDSSSTKAAAAAAGSSTAAASKVCTLMSALLCLQQQSNLFRKSAADLVSDEDDQDSTAAVCLALDISSLVQDISEANDMFTATMVAEKGQVLLQPVSAAAGDRQTAAAAAGDSAGALSNGAGSSSRKRSFAAEARHHSRGITAAATVSTAAAAAAEAQYVSALRPFQFIEADLWKCGNHFFRSQAQKQTAAGGEVMRKRLRRITEELSSLSTNLPISLDSSILLACDSGRLDMLRALLLPHPDTPYGGGAFVFDILLPDTYPDKPPLVQFLTTGGGRVRFNPNLYECGKVCLSLLGTWSGPSWQPGVSTLLQVLVSLQSMVFVPDPYYNEPGYEAQAQTAHGKQQSTAYNQNLRLQTAKHAILPMLRSPDPVFQEALQLHYCLRRQAVVDMLQKWVTEAGQEKAQLRDTLEKIKAELSKLPASTPAAISAAAPAPQQQQQNQQQNQQQQQQRRAGKRCSTSAQGSGAVQQSTDVVDLT